MLIVCLPVSRLSYFLTDGIVTFDTCYVIPSYLFFFSPCSPGVLVVSVKAYRYLAN